MKALVSVDLEGMPYIVIPGHIDIKGSLYEEARKIATKVTLIVVDELNKNGFDHIIVADSHDLMVNVHVDDLPEYVDIIRGYPRPLSMVAGIEGCDAAVFLGYHAKFGTAKSTADHTFSGANVTSLEVNGTVVSEFLLYAYVAGELNVPVIMVAGEARLIDDDIKENAPWVETVKLKHSLSRVSAQSPSLTRIEKELQEATKRAAGKHRKGGFELLRTAKPTKVKIVFQRSHFADVAEMLPEVRRLSGLEVECSAKDIIDALKIFELLMFACSGMTSLLERMG